MVGPHQVTRKFNKRLPLNPPSWKTNVVVKMLIMRGDSNSPMKHDRLHKLRIAPGWHTTPSTLARLIPNIPKRQVIMQRTGKKIRKKNHHRKRRAQPRPTSSNNNCFFAYRTVLNTSSNRHSFAVERMRIASSRHTSRHVTRALA